MFKISNKIERNNGCNYDTRRFTLLHKTFALYFQIKSTLFHQGSHVSSEELVSMWALNTNYNYKFVYERLYEDFTEYNKLIIVQFTKTYARNVIYGLLKWSITLFLKFVKTFSSRIRRGKLLKTCGPLT